MNKPAKPSNARTGYINPGAHSAGLTNAVAIAGVNPLLRHIPKKLGVKDTVRREAQHIL